MVEDHVPFQLHIGGGVVGLVVMLPGPETCTLFAFRQFSIRLSHGVHQLHIALVHLRLLVHEPENPVRARQSHDDAVELLAHLVDGHVEGFVEIQEAGKASQGQSRHAGDGQDTAHNGADHVAQVAQLRIDGHHDIGETVSLVSAVEQLFVQLIELLQALLLVAEHLDHLLACHSLLDASVQGAQGLLLSHEITAAQGSDFLRGHQHHGHHQQRHQRQRDIQHQHTGEYADHRDGAVDYLRDALADHLAQGVDVVGVHGHDVTMGMGVEIFDGQSFHLLEHVVPDVPQSALADVDQYPGLGKRRHHAQSVETGHFAYGSRQGAEIRVSPAYQGQNVSIYQRPHEHRPL